MVKLPSHQPEAQRGKETGVFFNTDPLCDRCLFAFSQPSIRYFYYDNLSKNAGHMSTELTGGVEVNQTAL
ncbi:hypothetical protein XB02_01565 [Pantoea ananatis]|nr:hypothetical protein XB02_01565 [Pantoea ananatis]